MSKWLIRIFRDAWHYNYDVSTDNWGKKWYFKPISGHIGESGTQSNAFCFIFHIFLKNISAKYIFNRKGHSSPHQCCRFALLKDYSVSVLLLRPQSCSPQVSPHSFILVLPFPHTSGSQSWSWRTPVSHINWNRLRSRIFLSLKIC